MPSQGNVGDDGNIITCSGNGNIITLGDGINIILGDGDGNIILGEEDNERSTYEVHGFGCLGRQYAGAINGSGREIFARWRAMQQR